MRNRKKYGARYVMRNLAAAMVALGYVILVLVLWKLGSEWRELGAILVFCGALWLSVQLLDSMMGRGR